MSWAVTSALLALLAVGWARKHGVWISGVKPKRARWIAGLLGLVMAVIILATLVASREGRAPVCRTGSGGGFCRGPGRLAVVAGGVPPRNGVADVIQVPVFDPVIHAPGRLQICAMLSAVDQAEFATVRDAIAVSDSVMSKHLKLLEDAGYVALRKSPFNGRSRTWLRLTKEGRKAFAAHVAELNRLATTTIQSDGSSK